MKAPLILWLGSRVEVSKQALQQHGPDPTYRAMIKSALLAISDVLSSDLQSVLWKAIGLALALFITILVGAEALFWFMQFLPWRWAQDVLAVVAGLGLVVLFFFLMAPVTALFAGLYLDTIAAKVEARHYGKDAIGTGLSGFTAIKVSLQFGLLILLINILALPFIFTGIGAILLVVINAYLISREYFEMAAMRHLPVDEARELRKENGPAVFAAGFLPALLALVPLANLLVPLFATSYFVHLFKNLQRSSA
jgi:CysZ protein